jgi:hypothetical protein
LVASVAIVMLALAGPAAALVSFTSSQITAPTDNSVVTLDRDNPNTMHVTGTTSGAAGNADLVCFYGSGSTLLAPNVTVTANAFSADIPLDNATNTTPKPYCLMRAVPTGDSTVYPPTGPNNSFAGPRILIGNTRTYKVGGSGVNQNVVRDFFVGQAQTRGYMDYGSFGWYGLDYSFVFDPLTLAESNSLFWGNAWTKSQNGCGTGNSTCAAATQSELTVDDKNAYAPETASGLYHVDATHSSELLPGFPALTFSESIDPLSGNAHITETDPIVKCSPGETAFHASNDPAWNTDCTSFASTGIKLDRTIDSDQSGRRTKIVDVWTNTDGVSHNLEVLYDEEFNGDSSLTGSPSFAYSWINGSSFSGPAVGETVQGPGGSGPATIYVDGNGDAEDAFQFPQGAVTVSPAPTSIRWYYSSAGSYAGTFRFAQTIPAGATATIMRTYVDGGSKESIAAKGAAEQDRLGSPTVAITSPANGSTTDNPAATVTGTASDPGGAVTSLKVNGDAVAVAADGTWSKALTLAPGANTITAEARDAAANTGSATVKVTYTPKVVPPVKPPPLGLAIAIAKTRLAALLSKGLPVTVSCSAPCTFSVSLTIDSKTAKALHLSKVVALGTASASLTTAGKQTVVVKLTKKAKKALKKAKAVAISVKATGKDKAGNSSTLTRKVTVKR